LKLKKIKSKLKNKIFAQFIKRNIDFFVIGGMKCGTTSLWHYLGQHPEIQASKLKEPCFFSYNYKKGDYWYYNQFGKKNGKSQKLFDASPVYIHDERSAALIHKYFPGTKLIALLRDPIERTISHYNFYSNPNSRFAKKNTPDRLDTRSFEVAIENDMQGIEKRTFYRYCSNSLYGKQLHEYLKYFDRKNLQVLDQADLLLKPKQTMLKILKHVGVSNTSYFESFNIIDEKIVGAKSLELDKTNNFKKYNSLEYKHELSDEIERCLIEFFKKDVALLKSKFELDFEWMKRYE